MVQKLNLVASFVLASALGMGCGDDAGSGNPDSGPGADTGAGADTGTGADGGATMDGGGGMDGAMQGDGAATDVPVPPPTLVDRLRECGFLSGGQFRGFVEGLLSQCELDCLTAAECAALNAELCGETDTCQTSCQFTCGDGASIPSSAECDGEPDCDDGSDEAGCETFLCGGGGADAGAADAGAADAGATDGGAGTSVPAQFRCDGFDDCPDGSDEAGCETFTCNNGEVILAIFECDGFDDCGDGSDEPNRCAELTLTCGGGGDGGMPGPDAGTTDGGAAP